MSKFTDTSRGRAIIVWVAIYVAAMALASIPMFFSLQYGWIGYVLVTGFYLWALFLMYLVPRVSNWVQYRKWDAKTDHYE